MSDASPPIEEFEIFADRLADVAAVETMKRFRKGGPVFNKAGIWFDPVTDADREAERMQRRMINAVYPKHGIIGEEFGAENEGAPYRWVLDPVDGTRSFVCGAATWATLIALEEDTRPILSIIDQPFTKERWRGVGGKTRYSRGRKKTICRTSGVTALAKARVSTTDPRSISYFTASEAKLFDEVARKAQVTRFSLDAYAYCLLALGEMDLVIETGMHRHDYSALIPIVEGAGGVITNWLGEPVGTRERASVAAAATPELHAEVLDYLKDYG